MSLRIIVMPNLGYCPKKVTPCIHHRLCTHCWYCKHINTKGLAVTKTKGFSKLAL